MACARGVGTMPLGPRTNSGSSKVSRSRRSALLTAGWLMPRRRRAARRLGMSQPAVSKALRRLRETFNDPLFVRGPSGIVPTPRAHAIVRAARPHLQHLQEDLVKDERFDPATSTRPIDAGDVRHRRDGVSFRR